MNPLNHGGKPENSGSSKTLIIPIVETVKNMKASHIDAEICTYGHNGVLVTVGDSVLPPVGSLAEMYVKTDLTFI